MRAPLKVFLLWLMVVVTCAAVAWLSIMYARAREGGNWSNVDPVVREWIGTLVMPDMPSTSCCGEADAYEADMGEVGSDGQNYAIITGYRGTVSNALPLGTKLLILPSKVQNKQGNPSGHVIVFANTSGTVYCFVPDGSN